MGFLKHLWSLLFVAALALAVGGVIWYLLFYGGQRDYAGGMLVQAFEAVKGMV